MATKCYWPLIIAALKPSTFFCIRRCKRWKCEQKHQDANLNTRPAGSTSPPGWTHHITLFTIYRWISAGLVSWPSRESALLGIPLRGVSIMIAGVARGWTKQNYYTITSRSRSFHSPHVAVDDILSWCPACRSHSPAYKSTDELPFGIFYDIQVNNTASCKLKQAGLTLDKWFRGDWMARRLPVMWFFFCGIEIIVR